MRNRILATVIMLLAIPAVRAGDAEPEIPWETIKTEAGKYLEVCVAKDERDSMDKKMQSRIDQRCKDTGDSRDDAAREIMFDWAASNQGNLKKKEPKAVAQVCYYFVMFMDNHFLISTQIRKSLTPSLVEKILAYLKEEVKRKQG